jgi:hypothetical protein
MPTSTNNNKVSRKTIIVGLTLVFLVVGLIASFIVVQQSVDLRNRASELTCRMNLVKCSWEWEGALPPGVDSVEYEYSVSGPCNSTTLRPCSGVTDNTSIEFEGYPGGSYTCNVQPKVLVSGEQCPVDAVSGSGSCPLESTPDEPGGNTTPNTPDRVPGESCSCSDDGGKLNCNAKEDEKYKGNDGAGLIILDPVYEVGDNACFACQKLRVKDSSGKVIKEISGCSLGADDEKIRLHQAPVEAGKCETYTVEAIGSEGEQATPKTCQTCKHSICCPACVPPQNLDVVVPSTDINKPLNTTMADSCSFQCDFSIDFGGGNQCGAAGKKITLTVPKGKCIDIDDDYAKTKEVCDTDNDGKIIIEYDRGGVYDLALDCNELAVSNVVLDADGTPNGAVSSLPHDLKCKKRITVACSGGDTPDGPDTPDTPDTPDKTTDNVCKALDVELICHNCSQNQ